jgi:competence protein ComEC
MEFLRRHYREVVVLALILSNVIVWSLVIERRPNEIMSVYFLDVGQGDAIFIDSPSHGQALIDGGRNRQVLTELGKILPFADRNIDVVIATHPDADHIGGLPEVASQYDIGAFIYPGVESDNSIDEELNKRLDEKSISKIEAMRGLTVNFGDGARLVVLFPNTDVSRLDPNDASIVARLDYGQSSFLLTGDAGLRTENILINLKKEELDADVLKAGHHGSRTSSSRGFVQAVTPEYSIISAGHDNTYGHPHKEVLDILTKASSSILSTAILGTIKFETDGKALNVK